MAEAWRAPGAEGSTGHGAFVGGRRSVFAVMNPRWVGEMVARWWELQKIDVRLRFEGGGDGQKEQLGVVRVQHARSGDGDDVGRTLTWDGSGGGRSMMDWSVQGRQVS